MAFFCTMYSMPVSFFYWTERLTCLSCTLLYYLLWRSSMGHCTPDVSHQCWVEGKDHLPQPAGNALPNTAQEAAGFLCCQSTLLAHGHLDVHQDSQVLFCKVSFQTARLQAILMYGFIPLQVQSSALPILELHELSVPWETNILSKASLQHGHNFAGCT